MTRQASAARFLVSLVACLLVVAVTGCGGGQDPAAPPQPAQAATAASMSRALSVTPGAAPVVSGPVDLGGQPAAAASRVTAINDRGQAVGVIDGRSPFIWDEGAGLRPINGLPSCGGDTASVEVNDINLRGQVVGTVRCVRIGGGDDISTVSIRAFVWSFAQGAKQLPEPLGQPFTQAAAINEQGAVVGQAAASASATPVAVLWSPDGSVRILGSLAGGRSAAADINDAGQVVGTSDNRAFVWTERDGMRDLGTLGGPSSSASRVNNIGQIVGTSTTGATPVVVAAFLWTPEQGMRGLGTLGGVASFANAINDDGLIVGNSVNAAGQTHAVLWSPAGDIQDLGGNTSDALGADNHGRIVGSSFVAQPDGTRLLRAVTWVVQPGAGAEFSLWRDSVRPAVESEADPGAVELGVRFKTTANGWVRGIRFYRSSPSSQHYVVNLWAADGTRLATAPAPGGSTGWVRIDFAAPVRLQANRIYVASYFAPEGAYPVDVDFFAGAGAQVGPLRALADEDGCNGVYQYGANSKFPAQSFRASNYWVDVVFETSAQPSATTSLSFWNELVSPRWPVVDDPSPVELGVRFRSRDAGVIAGIRFHRGAVSTQPYAVNLWTAEGQLLYTAEVVGDAGWVVAMFAQPITIEPNKDYVASYFAPEGQYAADNDYFAHANVRSGPLEAPNDTPWAGNGLYLYAARGGFPTQSYRATNYWVDILFERR